MKFTRLHGLDEILKFSACVGGDGEKMWFAIEKAQGFTLKNY